MIKGVSKQRRIVSILVIISLLATMCVVGSISASAASTGTGLAQWALNAYNNKWSYVYGGTSEGAVDCSGLIYTYNGVGGNRVDMLGSSSNSGSVSNGIPNVHGLGLWQPGHVGVYVGGGMAVDARNEYYGVCYESAYGKSWQMWFYVAGVSYPDTGWEQYNGQYYYYENGQYITDTSRTIDGVTYNFASDGASDQTPSDMDSTASSGSSTSGSSNSNSSSSSSSSSNSSSSSTTLRNGDSGDSVTKLQQRLAELGFYDGEITGYFGDYTEEAYKSFQTAAGVTVDGIAGASDLEILYSDSAPSAKVEETTTATEAVTEDTNNYNDNTPTSYSNGDETDYIYEIQNQLISLGYFNYDATGYFGDYTEQAIKDFQLANNLEVTGVADEDTLSLLFSDDAISNPNPVIDTETQATATATEDEVAPATVQQTPAANNVQIPTDVVLQTNELSSKALSAVTNTDASSIQTSDSTSWATVIWITVIVFTLGLVLFVAYKNEQSKQRARRARAKARAKRYW